LAVFCWQKSSSKKQTSPQERRKVRVEFQQMRCKLLATNKQRTKAERKFNMPKVTSMKEVGDLDDQMPIALVRGKVTQIFKAKRGPGDDGNPWSFQNLKLKDATGERKVVLKNRDDVPMDWRGKEIVIEGHHGEKGWSGIYASDNEYNGKTTREIKVTGSAGVFLASEVRDSESSSQAPSQKAPPAAANGSKTASAPAVGSEQPDKRATQLQAIKAAKSKAARLANLFTIAIDAVEAIVVPHWNEAIGSDTMSEDQHQAAISTLFIAMQRDGLDTDLPVKKLEDVIAEQNGAAAEAARKAAEQRAKEIAEEESRRKAEELRKAAENYDVKDDDIPF
jgi:hypothetical protein